MKSKTSKGLYTGMLLLDLQNAFDTVNHDILLKPLVLDQCLGLNLVYPVDNFLYISIMYYQTHVMKHLVNLKAVS